jgi:hypothetical protein
MKWILTLLMLMLQVCCDAQFIPAITRLTNGDGTIVLNPASGQGQVVGISALPTTNALTNNYTNLVTFDGGLELNETSSTAYLFFNSNGVPYWSWNWASNTLEFNANIGDSIPFEIFIPSPVGPYPTIYETANVNVNGNGITNYCNETFMQGTGPIGNGAGLSNCAPGSYAISNGCAGNGLTDDTVAMQSLLATPGTDIYLGTNSYLLQELKITNNITIHSQGAHWIYATGATHTNIFVVCGLNSNITLVGSLYLDGGNYSSIATRTFNYYAGSLALNIANAPQMSYYDGSHTRHGLQLRSDGNNQWSGLVVYGFAGCGVIPVASVATPAGVQNSSPISGITCFTNLIGLFSSALLQTSLPGFLTNWITNYVPNGYNAEYTAYTHLNLWGNAIGMVFSTGNCHLADSSVSQNYFNRLDTHGANDHHTTIANCDFNHALYCNWYIYYEPLGETITGCQFRGNINGPIILTGCAGFNFNGNQFDNLLFTNVIPTAPNEFVNNSYSGTWASQSISFDPTTIYDLNFSYTVIGDTDGQPLTMLHTNNGVGLTNLTAANIVGNLTNSTSGNAAIATNLVSGATATNIFITNFTASGGSFTNVNGGGLTNVSAKIATNLISGAILTNSILTGTVLTNLVTNSSVTPVTYIWFTNNKCWTNTTSNTFSLKANFIVTNGLGLGLGVVITQTNQYDGTVDATTNTNGALTALSLTNSFVWYGTAHEGDTIGVLTTGGTMTASNCSSKHLP